MKLLLICFSIITINANLFNEETKAVFSPNKKAIYFGYTVLLRSTKPIQ